MFLNDNGVNPNGKTYIGDFTTGTSTISASYTYQNFITAINSQSPEGGTPTGPVMWDALNYFAQNSPKFGGFSVMTGSTDTADEWRNPLYECNSAGSCVLTSCAKNFVVIMTDGLWNTPSCSSGDNNTVTYGGVKYSESDPAYPAYLMHEGFTNGPTSVSTSVSAVYTIGLFLSAAGQSDAADGVLALENIAMYGSFNQTGYTWPAGTNGFPNTQCTSAETNAQGCPSSPLAQGSGCTPLPAVSTDWSTSGNGLPDTFFDTSSAADIQSDIYNSILDALRRAASGTAASLLTTSQGSGAILSQAVFYPQRQFGSTVIDWTSELQALWYYLDPALQSSVIMENDNNTSSEDLLNISGTVPPGDYVLNFRFDTTQLQTVVDRCTNDGTGICSNTAASYVNTVNIGNVNALWQAGSLLWARNVVSSPRNIYTTLDLKTLTSFTGLSTSSSTVQSLLQASNAAAANSIINYVQGIDQTGFRNRTVTIGSANGVWKLGDIVDSTPKVEAASPLNQYNLQAPQGYSDTSYGQYIGSFDYLTRNMVYASANDGMLHAFELGTLDVSTSNIAQKAILCDDTSGKGNCEGSLAPIAGNLGNEQWAFIPNNALSYLAYMTNPNYCHLFYVDGPLYLFDASINIPANCQAANYYDCPKQTSIPQNQLALNETSWQTVLIGSMGMGGASTYSGASCNTVAGLTNQCVISPLTNSGLSSYFALNVTEPLSPSLMWEFSNPALGFTMAGPVVVRISSISGTGSSAIPVNTTNGHWFAVFASGPTGPIAPTSTQFLGRSDQDLWLYIVDLPTGNLLRSIDTGIPNAFAVSDFNSSIDTDRWNSNSPGFYQDNAFYIGYVKQCPSTNTSCTDTTWTNGGVLRVITKENPDPNQWVVSKVIDDIGPVTTSVTKLQDTTHGNLWLYFGTGRFFFKTSSGMDDPTNQRAIYGIVEPCYNDGAPNTTNTIDPNCPVASVSASSAASVSASALTNRTTDNSTAAAAPAPGWYINLALSSGTSLAERVITDPLASPNGIVYFTTFAPNSDLCTFGGSTYLWAVGYNTGTSDIDVTPSGSSTTQTKLVSSLMVGKALMQVSTGSIAEENLATTFASGRKSSAITGQPPKGQGVSVIVNPQPIKQIMHIKER
jgi:type IV pilus assembly protein PilY1